MHGKRLVAVLAAGLILRWGVSLATERAPIFPDYYYTDARLFHENAQSLVETWMTGTPSTADIAPASALYTAFVAGLYRWTGPRPIFPKLLNGLASTAAAYFWYRCALAAAPPAASFLLLFLLAWPSAVFYGSQNFKDAHLMLLTSATLFCLLAPLGAEAPKRIGKRGGYFYLCGALLLALAALYRPHESGLIAAAVGLAALSALRSKPKPALASVAAAACGLFLFSALSPGLYRSFAPPERRAAVTDGDVDFVPDLPQSVAHRPLWTPQGLSQFRAYRHAQDERWARRKMHREISSQVLVDTHFESWLDVALFLPKGVFYALFMPLPGLYAVDGKIGRMLACAENLGLLLMIGAAVFGLGRLRPFPVPARALAAFFALNALVYGFFEFDLGSATRHRLQYFPALLAFSALAWTARSRRKENTSA